MNLLLVANNHQFINKLEGLIKSLIPDCAIWGTATTVFELKEILAVDRGFDLIFSEVELRDGFSFAAFQEAGYKKPIVFISESEQFAFQSFEYNCLDYLLKPVTEKRLLVAIQKYMGMIQTLNPQKLSKDFSQELIIASDHKKYKKRFLSRSGNRLCFIGFDSAAYFFSEDGVTFLIEHPSSQRHIVDHSLVELEKELLDPNKFFRINRSVIINVDFLAEMRPYHNGRMSIALNVKSEDPLIVAREKVSEFKFWLDQ